MRKLVINGWEIITIMVSKMSENKKDISNKYPDVDIKQYNELFSNKYYRRKALEIALDTRKFEIDLYWKSVFP